MTTLTFGTFVHLGLPQEKVRTSIEAALSVPEGFWAFKYDSIRSLVFVTWNASSTFKKSDARTSKYRLRLWSGNDPQNMAVAGREEVVEFKLDDLPWEHPVPKIDLELCFWFGIEKISSNHDGGNPAMDHNLTSSNTSGQQKWSDLIQELERTIQIYTGLYTEGEKWRIVVERFQRARRSIKAVDQTTIAQGRQAEWIKRELEALHGGVKELRKIVLGSEPNIGADSDQLETLKLENARLQEDKGGLQDYLENLMKGIEIKDNDINELSETVYRLQLENDLLKGDSDEDCPPRGNKLQRQATPEPQRNSNKPWDSWNIEKSHTSRRDKVPVQQGTKRSTKAQEQQDNIDPWALFGVKRIYMSAQDKVPAAQGIKHQTEPPEPPKPPYRRLETRRDPEDPKYSSPPNRNTTTGRPARPEKRSRARKENSVGSRSWAQPTQVKDNSGGPRIPGQNAQFPTSPSWDRRF
ncbi:hypothetical protein TWF281_009504 [Arthrobotrys megalospora]